MTGGQLARTSIKANHLGTTAPVDLAGGRVAAIIPHVILEMLGLLLNASNDGDVITWNGTSHGFEMRAGGGAGSGDITAEQGWHAPIELVARFRAAWALAELAAADCVPFATIVPATAFVACEPPTEPPDVLI